MRTTLLTITNTLYYTVDTSRVGKEDRSKAQPKVVRRAIKEKIRTMEEQENWRCATVIRDARNTKRIKIVCRDKAELQRVKKVA
jgi:hypothetical protein